ncbi:MAG: lysylphosphatidylglycerol synthase domain-containing protein [Geitlerinemataceae cyanobacterium]
MTKLLSHLKPHIRWVILGATLFFLVSTFKQNWQDVAEIQLSAQDWMLLGLSFLGTLVAQTWAGWVWGWILQEFDPTTDRRWATRIFLKTNIAKYLPGNIWHFYRRIGAARKAGISVETATLSVVLEALLMAASALLVAFSIADFQNWQWQALGLVAVAISIHPRILSPVAGRLSVLKSKAFRDKEPQKNTCQMRRYPLLPWLGELGFVLWRGVGFVLIVSAVGSISLERLPQLVGAFSLAWLLGLILPGAPGGLGVFEVAVLALLDGSFSSGELLSAVAIYRVVSILAEVGGAGLAYLDEHWQGAAKVVDG